MPTRQAWLPGVAFACLGVVGTATAGGTPPQLSFISERSGSRAVYLIAADGSGERLIAGGPSNQSNGPSSPDGSQLLITAEGGGPRADKLGAGQSGQEPERRFHFRLLSLPTGARPALGPVLAAGPLLPQPRAILRSPSFFPDGRGLIFESEPESEGGLRELFVLRLDGRSPPPLRQLTHNREGNFAPTVCGHSGYLAFTSSRDRSSELYRMRLDGSDLRRLTYDAGSKRTPRCAATGEQIYFVSDHEGADRIYSVHRNGSTPRRLTGRNLDPAWVEDGLAVADDGLRVAYTLRRAGESSRVYVVDRPRSRECQVPLPPGAAGSEPDWSPSLPSGRKLALTVDLPATGAPPTSGPARASATIFVSDAECGRATRLTASPGPSWHPLWLRR